MAPTKQKTGVQIEDLYPLSPSQKGMLLDVIAHTQQQTTGKYLELFLTDITSKLDLPAFRQTWQTVIQRHTALRTGFLWKNQAEPVQFVLKQASIDLTYLDWRAFSSTEQQQQQQAYLQDLTARGLPLGKPPLLHLALFQLDDQHYRFLWANHHLILDGWCTPLLFRELFACYQAQITGRQPSLPPAPPYRRYIDWLQQQKVASAQRFWATYLQGFRQPTLLGTQTEGPADSPAVDRPEERYKDSYRVLSADVTNALQAFAQQQQVTLNTVIQCTWALLLCRYSGQSDLLFGATVSGRPSAIPQVESIIGLFINTLPVRMQVTPTATFPEWLTQCQQQRFAADEYAFCSAGQIQIWSEVPGTLPLFYSLLVFQNYPIPTANPENSPSENELALVLVDSQGARTPYPLTILIGTGNELSFHLVHQRNCLQDEDIRKILDHWQLLLHAIISHPHQLLSQLLELIPTTQIPSFQRPSPFRQTTNFVHPRTMLERQIAQVWEQTLGVYPIGIHDNFFEIGGHSLLAVQLLAKLQPLVQQQLPLRTLFAAPTVAQLAVCVAQADNGAASTGLPPALIVLQPQGTALPLTCLPGAGGSCLYLYSLAQAMGGKRPIYALEPLGLDGKTPPFTTVEAVAAYQIAHLQRQQPVGPYHLAGHSFGGMVVYEMAQQLHKAGSCVGALIILDTSAPTGKSVQVEETELILLYERIIREEQGLAPLLDKAQLQPLTSEERLLCMKQSLEAAGLLPPNSPLDQIRGIIQVAAADTQSAGKYLPADYVRLPIHLFVAIDEERDKETKQALIDGWAKYGEVTVHEVPGTHSTLMYAPHVQVLAAQLQVCLQVTEKELAC